MVRVKNGANSRSFDSLVDQSVAEVRNNAIVCELLGLEGDESASIRRDGDVFSADDSDTLRDGDELIFARNGGSKGNA